jgi:argininosuccinate lyase
MSSTSAPDKPWGGRFTAPTNAFVEEFTASVSFDQRLALCDIRGSIAHAQMLSECGVLAVSEFETIAAGLAAVRADIEAGRFSWSVKLEDVHMNVESALVARVGEVGKKLHTAPLPQRPGRDRHSPVPARRDRCPRSNAWGNRSCRLFWSNLAEQRSRHPACRASRTCRAAQPVTFGHHMLAWFEMLAARRANVCVDCRARLNRAAARRRRRWPAPPTRSTARCSRRAARLSAAPAGKLAGRGQRSRLRHRVRQAPASLLMTHFSRMSEELILWNSQRPVRLRRAARPPSAPARRSCRRRKTRRTRTGARQERDASTAIWSLC